MASYCFLWFFGYLEPLGRPPKECLLSERIVARQQLGEAALWVAVEWGGGLAARWEGARRRHPQPLVCLPGGHLLQSGGGGATELVSRAGLCRQIAALPPAGTFLFWTSVFSSIKWSR